jgi:hypothetical protein
MSLCNRILYCGEWFSIYAWRIRYISFLFPKMPLALWVSENKWKTASVFLIFLIKIVTMQRWKILKILEAWQWSNQSLKKKKKSSPTEISTQMNAVLNSGHLAFQKCCQYWKGFTATFVELSVEPVWACFDTHQEDRALL